MLSLLLNAFLSMGLVLFVVALTVVLRATGLSDESVGVSESLLIYAMLLTALNTGSLLVRERR